MSRRRGPAERDEPGWAPPDPEWAPPGWGETSVERPGRAETPGPWAPPGWGPAPAPPRGDQMWSKDQIVSTTPSDDGEERPEQNFIPLIGTVSQRRGAHPWSDFQSTDH